MNCKYTIKNFRVFDEEGATFDLRPITILTGCNNSGKSSLVKSLVVFLDYVKHVSNNSRIDRIDLYSNGLRLNIPEINLGYYENVLNSHSKDKTISFEISLYSHILFEEITLLISFEHFEGNKAAATQPSRLTIKNSEGVILYDWYDESSFINFDCLLRKCFTFLFAEVDNTEGILSLDLSEQKIADVKSCINRNKRERLSYGFPDDMIFYMYKDNIFYYLPIYDEMFKLGKYESISHVKNLMSIKNINSDLINKINFILDDFERSDHYNMRDYIHSWENQFLGKLDFYYCGYMYKENYFPRYSLNKDDFLAIDGIDYRHIYVSFALLSYYLNPKEDKYKIYENVDYEDEEGMHSYIDIWDKRFDSLFVPWFNRILPEIFTKEILYNLNHIDTTNLIQKKIYNIDTNDVMANILDEYLNKNNKVGYHKDYFNKGDFINLWIQNLKIGDHISIYQDEEGVGVYIKLYKKNDDNGTLLVYNGSGIFHLILLFVSFDFLCNG